jgi:hypothetical protein
MFGGQGAMRGNSLERIWIIHSLHIVTRIHRKTQQATFLCSSGTTHDTIYNTPSAVRLHVDACQDDQGFKTHHTCS